MLDAAPIPFQRTKGDARVHLTASGGDTRLAGLRQAGSAKALLPRAHAAQPEVVFLNTAGGLTGGDRLDYRLDLDAGARATAATQTAERAYASSEGTAHVTVDITLGAGAELAWLPQETILFDHAALHRRTTVRLGPDARFLGVETLVIGRQAMGETVRNLSLWDQRRIECADGTPIFIDAVGLTDADLARRDTFAGLADYPVVSTLVLAAPDPADRLSEARALIGDSADAAATVAQGCLILRFRSHDSLTLRRRLVPVIEALRSHPMPRVWQI